MQLWETEEGQIYNKWIVVSEDLPGMYADIDKPAKYYCEQDPEDNFLMPTYYCNTINSDGKFDDRNDEDVGNATLFHLTCSSVWILFCVAPPPQTTIFCQNRHNYLLTVNIYLEFQCFLLYA